MPNDPTADFTFSQEDNYSNFFNGKIAPFWQQRQDGFLTGTRGTSLYWSSMTADENTKAIVFINGRIESVWKYQELFFDLFSQGYDVFSYDHRGQGASERLCHDPEIGFVDEFGDYIKDMALLVDHWPLEKYQHRHLIGHSMGGAIATRYLQQETHQPFDSLTLSSPMFGVALPWYFRPIAQKLAQWMAARTTQPKYAPGHRNYYPKPFEDNRLTQSLVRYQWFRELYEQLPQLKLGGPSTHWVAESLIAAQQCVDNASKLLTPTLLMQAQCDQIVDNASHVRFANQSGSHVVLESIANARHEILFETDTIRTPALHLLLTHLNQCEAHREKAVD